LARKDGNGRLYRGLVERAKGSRQLGRKRVERKIKIKWVLKKLCGIGVIGFIWIKIVANGGSL
jgi:hypothetical protein